MQEWFNWHAWKACVPQKGTGGSNPPLSAPTNQTLRQSAEGFCFTEAPKKACFLKEARKNKNIRGAGLICRCRDLSTGIIENNPPLSAKSSYKFMQNPEKSSFSGFFHFSPCHLYARIVI
jgi:hypothetical protein